MRRYYRWLGWVTGALLFLAACSRASEVEVAPVRGDTHPAAESVGRAAPDFTLETLAGEELSLSDYRDRLVIINFWASWCAPCAAEMPELQSYYEAHHEAGVVVLGVNGGEAPAEVREFVGAYGITFPVLLDSERRVMGQYAVVGLPSTFFVDPEGQLMGYWPGILTREMLEERLAPLLPGAD